MTIREGEEEEREKASQVSEAAEGAVIVGRGRGGG